MIEFKNGKIVYRNTNGYHLVSRYMVELANDMISKGHDADSVYSVLYYLDEGLITSREVLVEFADIIKRKWERDTYYEQAQED